MRPAACVISKPWRSPIPAEREIGFAGKVAQAFLRSKLTPLIVAASLLLGVAAVFLTPREEEPQLVVPMVDVIVPMPGATPVDVESQLPTPLERRMWGLPGVEYLRSEEHTSELQ